MTVRRSRPTRALGRHVEQLESRELLAGHAFAEGFSRLAALRSASVGEPPAQLSTGIAARDRAFAEFGFRMGRSEGTLLAATLTDAETGTTAKVKLTTYTEDDGTVETKLKVRVAGAAADTTLDVTIGDVVVGQVTTDSNGAGSLILSSDPDDDEQALPDNFPTDVAAGTAVAVGTMTGTLEVPARNHHGGCSHVARTVLRAALADSEGTATGTATYKTVTKGDETTTKLTVSAAGAAASSTLDVAVDGVVVGQLTTDADGAGSVTFASNPTGDEQQLPADFPAVTSGSAVTVGTLSGTFAAPTSDTSALFALRFGRRR